MSKKQDGEETAAEKSSIEKTEAEIAAAEIAAAEKAAAEKAATEAAVAEEAATKEAATKEAATEEAATEESAADKAAAENKPNDDKQPKEEVPVAGLIVLVLLVLAVGFLIVIFQASETTQLEILPAIDRPKDSDDSGGWTVSGWVLDNGTPVIGAMVRTIARDGDGNAHLPAGQTTDDKGQFTFDPIIVRSLEDLKVTATTPGLGFLSPVKRGEMVVELRGGYRLTPTTVGAVITVLAMFGLSICIALLPLSAKTKSVFVKAKYLASVAMALAFTLAMVWVIGHYQQEISTLSKDQAVPLGFINIFQATYVKDLSPEWVASLTLPPHTEKQAATVPTQKPGENGDGKPPITESAVIRGFGAPLWVILLAVVGGALLTVSLIVTELRTPPNFQQIDETDLRGRIQRIIQHQFFILFSPLGGIFVYQLLVVADAASQHLAVAIAALGSGAMLNALLDMAVQRTSRLLLGVSGAPTVSEPTPIAPSGSPKPTVSSAGPTNAT